jgi:hypothetical protein
VQGWSCTAATGVACAELEMGGPLIQDACNHHKLQTECNKTPIAIYELSPETAITWGYMTGQVTQVMMLLWLWTFVWI